MAVSYTYSGTAAQSGGTTDTLSVNVPAGADHADRFVVVCVRITQSGSPTTRTFTLGGNTPAFVRALSSTTYIVGGYVPTGATVPLACTVSGGSSPTISNLRTLSYRLVGPVELHDQVATSGFGSSLSIALQETAGGVTIAAATALGDVTWTYPTENGEYSSLVSAASATAASTGTASVQSGGSLNSALGAVHLREPIVDVSASLSGKLRLKAKMYDALPTATLAGKLRLRFAGSAAAGADGRISGKLRLGMAAAATIGFPEDYFRRLINSPKHGDPIVYLLTITHPALEEPARLALSRDGHDVTSNGAPFKAVYFEVEPVADLERGTASAKVRAPNVDRQIGALLDEQDEPAVVRIDLVTFASPDIIRKSWKRLRLRNARWDASMIEVEVAQKDFSRVPSSAIAATPAYCRALFK